MSEQTIHSGGPAHTVGPYTIDTSSATSRVSVILEISTPSEYFHREPQKQEAEMDIQGHYQPIMGSLGHDELQHVAVGDSDPTLHVGTARGYQKCRFKWDDKISQNLILSWFCTRELGHHGKHLAGTGDVVAAVHTELVPAATATNVLV